MLPGTYKPHALASWVRTAGSLLKAAWTKVEPDESGSGRTLAVWRGAASAAGQVWRLLREHEAETGRCGSADAEA